MGKIAIIEGPPLVPPTDEEWEKMDPWARMEWSSRVWWDKVVRDLYDSFPEPKVYIPYTGRLEGPRYQKAWIDEWDTYPQI